MQTEAKTQTAKEILRAVNLHKTHWGVVIIQSEEEGAFNSIDERRAGSWTTCACGKQDPRIPRHSFSRFPLDDDLRLLGEQFNDLVRNNEFVEAANCLIAIEQRSAIVLAEAIKQGAAQ